MYFYMKLKFYINIKNNKIIKKIIYYLLKKKNYSFFEGLID